MEYAFVRRFHITRWKRSGTLLSALGFPKKMEMRKYYGIGKLRKWGMYEKTGS